MTCFFLAMDLAPFFAVNVLGDEIETQSARERESGRRARQTSPLVARYYSCRDIGKVLSEAAECWFSGFGLAV